MPSEAAKKAAGTYIRDDIGSPPPVLRWALKQCRYGVLARHVQSFCVEQMELLDPLLVQVESVTSECIQCRIPCRLYDHESAHPYNSEVRFTLNPVTGEARRL
jgi:hypothetical protein